ncbi:recombination protein NinB [Massilia sp. TS11]|uniref:recombination protein NinB n=1 Tax=Massilia sp. TS11 TaxID=2908003 RepID=UPI001EDB4113|nr:recombination protein NinB [Massilia sp. TS11]MCG2586539.1 recombination protein NinB [Massilia sp. TS11]
MKQTIVLAHEEARRRALQAVQSSPAGYVVTISEPTRNLEQNAAMWAKLNEIAAQVVWHGRKLDAESWKCIFTAALKHHDSVPGINGGFVVLGLRTSAMTKREMSDLLELITAFGAARNVKFGA